MFLIVMDERRPGDQRALIRQIDDTRIIVKEHKVKELQRMLQRRADELVYDADAEGPWT